jgi:hypothetical protein
MNPAGGQAYNRVEGRRLYPAFQTHAWTLVTGRKEENAAFFQRAHQQVFRRTMQAVPMALEILDGGARHAGKNRELRLCPVEQSTRRATLLRKEIHSIKALPNLIRVNHNGRNQAMVA